MRVDTTRSFLKELKRLVRKYPRVAHEVDALLDQLEEGTRLGDRVVGTELPTYKVRLPNWDANRGKSGGFRVLYFIELADLCWFLTIHSKSDRASYTAAELNDLMAQHFETGSEEDDADNESDA